MTHAGDSTHQAGMSDSVDSPKSAPMPGRIGRYRVTAILGEGGFGTVYRATDESLGREVAIKVPRRQLRDLSAYTQWTKEARVVAMLDHPSIVPVYDVGETPSYPFFVVSKFIEGIDMRARLRDQRPSLELAVRWCTEIADALEHAHSLKLVHRDVKPSNILIDTSDRAWLTDFGLALHDDDVGRDAYKGGLVGTYAYMSPEQARGEGHLVDGRADVFALGIVLYEMLIGSRPFAGDSCEQLLRSIVRADPRPPRQADRNIPVEVDRICMKSLAQRRSDRYRSCHDLAADLRRFTDKLSAAEDGVELSITVDSEQKSAKSGVNSAREAKVIPKGLRAFDEHDQDFFLKLVPGPRDLDGVPEILRQLKIQLESRDVDESFRVGMLYGSSGSGKSSLIRAGLLPLLDPSVEVVYVEANARHTEMRIEGSLSHLLNDESIENDLVRAMTAIRKGAIADGRKVVIVLDQFEQWLHAHAIMENTELVNSIRQCDGVNLQCLVLIRDDFWMPATRFFHELDIRLVQGVNSTAVDRFDLRHAKYVLSEFGRAYGCLPESRSEYTDEHTQFLDAVIDSVQEDGKVISIHLVVLAQMLKGCEWNMKTFADFGGRGGIDINFLDATFSDANASPHHRSMQVPARAVLAELLPEVGTDIKGQMKGVADLKSVSKLNDAEFVELLEALDGELRMITPTVASGSDDESQSKQCYQLTHDFLVPPLREWLTRNDRSTRSGRAKLRLQELTQYWRRNNESRFLPSSLELLQILAYTKRSARTTEEAKLVSAATRHHGTIWAIAAAFLMLIGWGGIWVNKRVQAGLEQQEGEMSARKMLTADVDHMREAIETLEPLRDRAEPLLKTAIENEADRPAQALSARLFLVAKDPSHIQPLVEATQTVSPEQIRLICERLQLHPEESRSELWKIVESESVDESHWLRAAYALAQLDAENEKWRAHARRLARTIANQNTVLVVEMAPGFAPLASFIAEPLRELYQAQEQDVRINAASVLAVSLKDSPADIASLLTSAVPAQFELLVSVAKENSSAIKSLLKNELAKRPGADWRQLGLLEHKELDASIQAAVAEYQGITNDDFIICQRLPLNQFDEFCKRLMDFGYRPNVVRAYHSEGAADSERNYVAAIWLHDGKRWRFTRHVTGADIPVTQDEMAADGLIPTDVTTIPAKDSEEKEIEYGVLWTQKDEDTLDSRIYVDVPDQEHGEKGWGPLFHAGFAPKTNLRVRHFDGEDRFSSVRWRRRSHPDYGDAWNDSPKEFERPDMTQWYQSDIRINPPGMFDDSDISFGGVWLNGGQMEYRRLLRLNDAEHLEQSQTLIKEGFRPNSISVVEVDDAGIAASTWQRPIVMDRDRDQLASRQANAVIALHRLGATESLWPLLELTEDPRVRSFLIDRLAEMGVDPESLVDHLITEPNDSRKFAIIAALSRYRPEQLSGDLSNRLRSQIQRLGIEHPSAAIHSICEAFTRAWGWSEMKDRIRRAPNLKDRARDGSWRRSEQNHEMVTIVGPVEYDMGSPGNEMARDKHKEVRVPSRIPRSFAIGIAEVTLEQFQEYDPLYSYSADYTHSSECPLTNCNLYEAMCYCRWLSEKEGIDEQQMCYPTIEEIKAAQEANEPVKLPKDFLKRTGYRLPTECEWEYACRAGTITSRPYGASDDLLPRYAWTTESSRVDSRVRFHPVKGLLPNDLGIFDMLGNVMEWCHTIHPDRKVTGRVRVDERADMATVDVDGQNLLGSGVFYLSATMRSANRERARMYSKYPFHGFRIARTIAE